MLVRINEDETLKQQNTTTGLTQLVLFVLTQLVLFCADEAAQIYIL